MIILFSTCMWDFYNEIGVEYLMPHPCKRISLFHLIIIGLSLLINHTPKSKPQNFASRKFHKILDDHIILHKTRGGSTSAPSFSASFCSLCTWSKLVISIEALAEMQNMCNCTSDIYPFLRKLHTEKRSLASLPMFSLSLTLISM